MKLICSKDISDFLDNNVLTKLDIIRWKMKFRHMWVRRRFLLNGDILRKLYLHNAKGNRSLHSVLLLSDWMGKEVLIILCLHAWNITFDQFSGLSKAISKLFSKNAGITTPWIYIHS